MAALTANGVGTCGPDDNQAQAGHLIAQPSTVIGGGLVHSLTSEGHDASEDGTGRGTPVVVYCKGETDERSGDQCEELRRNRITVQPLALRGREGGAMLEIGAADEPSYAIRAAASTQSVGSSPLAAISSNETIVRRLTPTECERLQGYPDGWTEGQPDSARYRQLGNSVAVPCVEWIARRLISVDEETQS